MKNEALYRKLCTIVSVILMCSCSQIQQSFIDTFERESSGRSNDSLTNQDATSNKNLKKIPEQEDITPVEEPEEINFLSDSAGLRNAQLQLTELPKFKGKEIMFHSDIHFYDDGRINLQVQDPDTPEYLDSYSFRDGKWGKPKPVRTHGRAAFESELFPLSDLDFMAVSRIFNEMTAYAQRIEGAETVTHIYFLRMRNRGGWRASVSGSREGYSVTADITGKQVKFERN